MTAHCHNCGVAYEPKTNRTSTYCTRACRNRANYWRLLHDNGRQEPDDWSPMEWDGETRYSDTPSIRRTVAVCLSCARRYPVNPAYVELLDAFTLKCGHCYGSVLLEEDDVAGVGSVTHATNKRYAEMQRAWGDGI